MATQGGAADKGGGAKDGGSKGKDKAGTQTKDSGNGPSPSSSNGPFESQMLAYGAIDQIAQEFVSSACDALKNSSNEVTIQVVLYDSATFASVPNYGAFALNLSLLKNQYNVIQKKLSGGAASTSAFMDAASLVLQYSAASNTETGSNITLSDSAIRLSLAHYFTAPAPAAATPATPAGKKLTRCAEDKVIIQLNYPALANPAAFIETARKNTAAELDGLLDLKVSVQDGLQKAVADKKIAADDDLAKKLVEVNKSYDQFIAALTASDPNTGVPAIVGILQGRAIFEFLEKDNSYIVYEEAVAGGGTQKNRKNLYTNVISGDLISYSGGAIINLAMVNVKTSKIVLANPVRLRTDFTRIPKPQPDADTRAGDNLNSLKP